VRLQSPQSPALAPKDVIDGRCGDVREQSCGYAC
jgi:hypothetical protein